MEQGYKAVKDYQININYDIDKLINIVKRVSERRNKTIDDCIKDNVYINLELINIKNIFIGTRTTLENALKISNTEALNYLIGFPLNFNLESFVMRLFDDFQSDLIDEDIDKNKYLTDQETYETEAGHIVRLKLDFDKKKKLIRQNFGSTTHIDKKKFLAWAERENFIKLIELPDFPPKFATLEKEKIISPSLKKLQKQHPEKTQKEIAGLVLEQLHREYTNINNLTVETIVRNYL
jgi:hypothetical protein